MEDVVLKIYSCIFQVLLGGGDVESNAIWWPHQYKIFFKKIRGISGRFKSQAILYFI